MASSSCPAESDPSRIELLKRLKDDLELNQKRFEQCRTKRLQLCDRIDALGHDIHTRFNSFNVVVDEFVQNVRDLSEDLSGLSKRLTAIKDSVSQERELIVKASDTPQRVMIADEIMVLIEELETELREISLLDIEFQKLRGPSASQIDDNSNGSLGQLVDEIQSKKKQLEQCKVRRLEIREMMDTVRRDYSEHKLGFTEYASKLCQLESDFSELKKSFEAIAKSVEKDMDLITESAISQYQQYKIVRAGECAVLIKELSAEWKEMSHLAEEMLALFVSLIPLAGAGRFLVLFFLCVLFAYITQLFM